MAETRKIIFSFDDGPAPSGALKTILSVLKSNLIRAEFYVLGSEVEKNPISTKSIVDQGHKIQNHSWSHQNLAKASEDEVFSELDKTQKIIEKITGTKPTKIRPPYGAGGWPRKFDPELAKVACTLGLSIYNWDIDTEDWKQPRGIKSDKFKKINTQLKQTKNKTVLNVLMHVQNETASDLPAFIKFFLCSDFSFTNPVN